MCMRINVFNFKKTRRPKKQMKLKKKKEYQWKIELDRVI